MNRMGRLAQGVTLIELMLVMAIIGVLASIGYPAYMDYMDRKDFELGKADIVGIVNCIERYYIASGQQYPDTLALASCEQDDPWGNGYEYFNIATATGKGKLRKDQNLNPINTFYDLYSKGKDGLTSTQLSAQKARDDIVRGSDGRFLGLAEEF